jgi:diketogulonate reductase-like aldo/keto reductase
VRLRPPPPPLCAQAGVDISKLALHFTLRNERIGTTLISSTSVHRMCSNLDAVNETLSQEEEAVLTHLREAIFIPAGTQSCAAHFDAQAPLLLGRAGARDP